MTTCSIDDCDNPVDARGWCATHYGRWRRTGDPLRAAYLRFQPDEVRFWHHVDKSDLDGCWLWTGRRNDQGYGIWAVKGRGTFRAPRVAYEFAVGPIPDGLHIRHRCDNPPCVRPDHLEIGTRQQNTDDRESRGRNRIEVAVAASAAARRESPTCKQGHPWTPATTYEWRGKRRCRVCAADRAREANRANALAAGRLPKSRPGRRRDYGLGDAGHRVHGDADDGALSSHSDSGDGKGRSAD